MSTTTTTALDLARSEPERSEGPGGRSIRYEWLLRMRPELDEQATRETNNREVVQLSITHYGDRKCFNVGLSRVGRADTSYGEGHHGTVEKFALFAGVSITRIACSRFSQKRLNEAADAALRVFRELVEAGDEKVLSYFDLSVPTTRGG